MRFPKTVLLLLVSAGAASAEVPCWQTPDDQPYTEISEEEALAASDGTVLLHFGNDFPDAVIGGIALNLDRNEFRTCIFLGGPPEKMELYIDGRKGKKPFSASDAVKHLLTVLIRNADHLRGLD